MKTILVTGSAGFIGSNLVLRLFKELSEGTIVGLDNMNDYYDPTLKDYRLSEIEKAKPAEIEYEFVKGDLADMALFIESFDKKNILSTRLSFSTKIIDCMQSGSAMMVIGPKGIASVEYPRKIDGVFVVDDLSLIRKTLCERVKNPHQIVNRAKHLMEYAKNYHEITGVRLKLQSDFQNIIAS